MFHNYDYSLSKEDTDFLKDGYIQPNQRKTKVIPDSEVYYIDFETYITGIHKTTEEAEPLEKYPSPNELGADQPKVFEGECTFCINDYCDRGDPMCECLSYPYEPYPYFKRDFNAAEYKYVQKVNWVEMQCADGNPDKTYVFQSMEALRDLLHTPQFNGKILIAHYGQGFDFQLLYEDMYRYESIVHGKLDPPIMKGNKIIKGKLYNDITLIDSFNYMMSGLSEMPKMFGFEELAKGYFPHKFNLPQFQDYIGPIPAMEYFFEYEEKKESVRNHFIAWHAKQVADRVEYCFRDEMEKYCHSDVDILRRGFQKFREMYITLRDLKGKDLGQDPLHYMTIASHAYDGVWRRFYLQPNTIKYVQRPTRQQYSIDSILWMTTEMQEHTIFIQHAENHGERTLELRKEDGTTYLKKVDGYREYTDPVTNQRVKEVYEYYGCFYHSCPYCYDSDELHPLKCDIYDYEGKNKVYHGQVYATTRKIQEDILRSGYALREMWECKFQKEKKKKNLRMNPDLAARMPLNPRDSYYGGRTNAVKLYYKVTGEEKIKYVDVTSMYPYVMMNGEYPIQEFQVRRFDDPDFPLIPLSELFGLQKCDVVPPKDLYHPVLPVRDEKTGKLLFPLHPISGTWTHVELQKAVSVGYVITTVYEQHHFPNTSSNLFTEYIDTFFELKNKAEQENNPGLKTVAKLCLNSMYGKFGYNIENQNKTEIVTKHSRLWEIMNGKYNRGSFDIINDNVCVATYHSNDMYSEHYKSNVYIAAFVTAYARLKLYSALELLGRRVCYFDTDSVVYVSEDGSDILPVDNSGTLGAWSNELKKTPDDYFVEFVSAGPKTYAMRSFSGKNDICKVKGITLSYKNKQVVNFDSIKDQVLHKAFGGDFCDEDEEDAQPNKKQKLVPHKNELMMRRNKFRLEVMENNGKMINMTYDKRCIVMPDSDVEDVTVIDTLPWGYVVTNT